MTDKVFSSGGGVQSCAALILSSAGILDYKLHVFSNVGDDSESPETLRYVREILIPYANQNGVEYLEVSKGGKTLLQTIETTEHSIPIPAHIVPSSGKKYQGNRVCTQEYKIRVIDRYIKNRFGNKEAPPTITVGLGISADEFWRAKKVPTLRMGASGEVKSEGDTDRVYWNKIVKYPFFRDEGFEFKGKEYPKYLTRNHCRTIIQDAGLPMPPKSACWFCPFHSTKYWIDLKEKKPDLFEKSIGIEKRLNEKGAGKVYLSGVLTRLENFGGQMVMEGLDDESCESGYCMV